MKSMRTKWGGWIAVLVAFVALIGGCSTQCDASLCIESAGLSGSITIAKGVTGIDSRLCVGSTCTKGSVDLAEVDADTRCPSWEFRPQVCLTKTSDPRTFRLMAVAPIDPREIVHDLPMHLTLVDHASGDVVLDETRTAKANIWRSDECQVCWSAEATL